MKAKPIAIPRRRVVAKSAARRQIGNQFLRRRNLQNRFSAGAAHLRNGILAYHSGPGSAFMMRSTFVSLSFVFASLLGGAQAADDSFFSKDKGVKAPARATMADLDAAEAAVIAVWDRLPYTARRAVFVSVPAPLFGAYDKRQNSVFAPGEKLLSYIEPVGYGWKRLDGDLYGFGVTVDFEILTASGKVLGGQRAFQKTDLSSHYRNREFFVSLTMTLDGIDPGDYVVAYTLHDNVSGRSARVEQPFTIKAAG